MLMQMPLTHAFQMRGAACRSYLRRSVFRRPVVACGRVDTHEAARYIWNDTEARESLLRGRGQKADEGSNSSVGPDAMRACASGAAGFLLKSEANGGAKAGYDVQL